jgi:universal stress protein A
MPSPVRKILVPVDFSPRSRAAVSYAVDLARVTHADVDVLHVVPPPSRTVLRAEAVIGVALSHASPEAYAHAEEQLEALISTVEHAGCGVRARVEEGDPAATTVQIATDDGHDLVVMGTHGRTGLAGVVLGSVAQSVINCAPCPVLTFRGRDPHLF